MRRNVKSELLLPRFDSMRRSEDLYPVVLLVKFSSGRLKAVSRLVLRTGVYLLGSTFVD